MKKEKCNFKSFISSYKIYKIEQIFKNKGLKRQILKQ